MHMSVNFRAKDGKFFGVLFALLNREEIILGLGRELKYGGIFEEVFPEILLLFFKMKNRGILKMK